ncbi:MAG: DUF3048 domain-containing protein [Candidatus Nomurabacteria bacterium]|nr:MAG: DUF3048 domain-containing protein [Candidatus Nomurabacteria bacterium]
MIDQKEPRTPGRARMLAPKISRFTKKQIIIFSLLLVVVVLVIIYFLFVRTDNKSSSVNISESTLKTSPTKKTYSPLTGAEVTEEQANRPLTALIIENSVDARPQSGLNQAGIVYEAIAEGGITRFATIYQENTPDEIGPVRSLRPYFLDWLRPYGPTVVHVGGSKRALSLVRDGTWKDMDQFANGKSFWRSKDRKAPHNVYTKFENIDKFNDLKGYKLEQFPTFARKDDQKASAPTTTEVKLNISSKLYNSVFVYNPINNSYLRSQGGAPHLDKSGTQIEPKVVVALIIPSKIVQEDGSRYSYATIGSGEAVVFQDGIATPATWTKVDQKSQIKLKDSSGAEIKLNRGKTWFTVLDSRGKLSYN